jgi:hypothetical protein
VGKYLPDAFPIKHGLEKGDTSSLLSFNFSLDYAIRMVQENKQGLELNGSHWFPVYADDNLLG